MSHVHRLPPDTSSQTDYNLAGRIALLIGSAIALSALTIFVFNTTISNAQLVQVYSGVELAALTLIPYMISAAVAAITAICIMALVPAARLRQPATVVKERLQLLSQGDLSGKIHVRGTAPHVQELVYELNLATSNLSHQIAQWKVINRQQWELLEAMREITVVSGQRQLSLIIDQMQRNWEKIAEIEARLTT